MKINAYYELGGRYWQPINLFGTICDKLVLNSPEEINVINSVPYRNKGNDMSDRQCAWNLVLENPENGKYFLVTYIDKLEWILDNPTHDLTKCVEIFTSVGVHKDDYFFEPVDIKFTPISNTVGTIVAESIVEQCFKNKTIKKHIPSKPTFRGLLYRFRNYLSLDERFDVQKSTFDHVEYIKYINEQKIGFGLNGGEISPRDIEIMGLGNTLFRTKLKTTKTHNPLIPNYHYVSVDWDDIPKIYKIETYNFDNYWKEMSDRVIDRYYEVSKDSDFLEFVSENGRKWYEENGTVDAAAEIVCGLLDFKKLL